MLVAVLNSNFWLATHVTTITIGYGTSLFAGVLGHVYLLQAIRTPFDKKYLKTVNANVFGATLFALFFTLFGTILGGIWADQSWGRFWGWDPKENGALLIVMWQIMMLHLRITGFVKPMGFALGMILNNIVVILAWFGVNLLNVGLHSYGFATGIAINISLFIAFELITGLGTYYWAKNRQKQLTAY
jgi:ABC-type transport system involved in cytochrome c biogenesis permease subunit